MEYEEKIRKTMQAVKSTNTSIERKLGKALWNRGYRYRKNDKKVFGKPDFTFGRKKIAIFVDGDFWHGRDWEIRKFDHKRNIEYWYQKIERNISRDTTVNTTLAEQGWLVLRFWGNDIDKKMLECIEVIENAIKSRKMMK